jgi:hypothetical protein
MPWTAESAEKKSCKQPFHEKILLFLEFNKLSKF